MSETIVGIVFVALGVLMLGSAGAFARGGSVKKMKHEPTFWTRMVVIVGADDSGWGRLRRRLTMTDVGLAFICVGIFTLAGEVAMPTLKN